MPSGQGLPFYASLNDNAFTRGIRSIESEAANAATRIGASFAQAGETIAVAGAAAAVAFAGFASVKIAEGVRDVFNLTHQLDELSDQTGISVGKLFTLGREFENAGLEADDAGASINKMQKFLQEGGPGGNAKIFDTLRLLHLNFLDIKQMSPEHQFQAIGSAIAAMQSPTARSAAAMEIFGRAGGRLLRVFTDPNFKSGGDLTGRAAILQRNAELFEQTSIALNRSGDIFKGFYTGVAERVAGPLLSVLDRLEKADLSKYGEMFGDYLVEGATGVVDMLSAIKKSDIVSTAKSFAGWLKWGAEQVADILGGFKDMFASDLKDIAAVSSLFGGSDDTSPSPSASGASGAGSGASDDQSSGTSGPVPMTISGPDSGLDDMTSLGIQMRQRMGMDAAGGPALKSAFFKPDDDVTGFMTGDLGNSGGLSGPGSDAGETFRQNAQQIRDQVKYQNPLLQGGALENAVRQEQQKQREQQQIQQYRDTYDKQHPGEAEARKAERDRNAGATSGDVKGTTAAIKELQGKIDKLFSQ